MKLNYKKAILDGLVKGVVFVIVLILLDIWKSKPFIVSNYVLYFLGFGLVMTITHLFKQKKSN